MIPSTRRPARSRTRTVAARRAHARLAFAAAAMATMPAHVLGARPALALLRAAVQDGPAAAEARSRTTRAPTPFGPPNLWALTLTRSAPAAASATIEPAEGLHGVGVHERPRSPLAHERHDGLERLAHPGLVVDEHHRDEPHRLVQRVCEGVEVEDAAAVDSDRAPTGGAARLEHRRVLDGAAEDASRGRRLRRTRSKRRERPGCPPRCRRS